jgi:hypothetical protein
MTVYLAFAAVANRDAGGRPFSYPDLSANQIYSLIIK